MIKKFIRFAIVKSTLNHILLAFIFMLSIFSYINIPKEIFPISSLNAIKIDGSYIGASSDMLDLMAVSKIEDELANISQADKITSIIKSGSFSINITLKSGYEVDEIIDEIKDIVSFLKPDWPSDMNEPTVSEVKLAIPLITASITANKSTQELLDLAKDIKKDLVKLGDLSSINIWGDSKKQLVITFDEDKINAYGLDKNTVISVISQLSSIFPAGFIKDKKRHYFVSSQNGQKDLKSLNNTILKISNKQIYLKDIATVQYKLADNIAVSHFNGQRNMSIGMNKGKSGDSIALVKQIKEILKNMKKIILILVLILI